MSCGAMWLAQMGASLVPTIGSVQRAACVECWIERFLSGLSGRRTAPTILIFPTNTSRLFWTNFGWTESLPTAQRQQILRHDLPQKSDYMQTSCGKNVQRKRKKNKHASTEKSNGKQLD